MSYEKAGFVIALVLLLHAPPVSGQPPHDPSAVGCPCNSDVNGDGDLNVLDLGDILDCVKFDFCACPSCDMDVNCDGLTDWIDVGIVVCAVRSTPECCTKEFPPDCTLACLLPVGPCTRIFPPPDVPPFLPCVFTLQDFCESQGGVFHGDQVLCGSQSTHDRTLEITIPRSTAGTRTAYRLTLVDLHDPKDPQPVQQPDYSPRNGEVRYLNLYRDENGDPVTECLSSPAFGSMYPCASVGCESEFVDWGALFAPLSDRTIYVMGNALIPDSTYRVALLPETCEGGDEAACPPASSELALSTARLGDTEPNGEVNITDVVNTVDVVATVPSAPWEYQVYVRAEVPDPYNDTTNVSDIVRHVDALKLISYVLPVHSCPEANP